MNGVKKIALSTLLVIAAAALAGAQNFPRPTGYVNDFAGVIGASDEAAISRIAETVKKATGAEIAVVSVESMEPYGSIEQFSIALASDWGIGEQGKDNGVLLVIAMKERKTRIEVGYGLEGAIPDGMVGRIMDTSMVPYFRQGDYGTGFLKTTEGIAGIIAKEYGVDLQGVSLAESEKYSRSAGGDTGSLIPFLIIVFIFFMGGGRFFWPLLFLGGMGRGRYTRGGFGSSSRGGFGGGGSSFGGFGGGGFGGGGASRGF